MPASPRTCAPTMSRCGTSPIPHSQQPFPCGADAQSLRWASRAGFVRPRGNVRDKQVGAADALARNIQSVLTSNSIEPLFSRSVVSKVPQVFACEHRGKPMVRTNPGGTVALQWARSSSRSMVVLLFRLTARSASVPERAACACSPVTKPTRSERGGEPVRVDGASTHRTMAVNDGRACAGRGRCAHGRDINSGPKCGV